VEAIRGTILATLMLQSQLGHMANDVLHLGISVAALAAAKVVKPAQLVEEEVDDGNDDGDSDGVTPDNDDSDDGGMAVRGQIRVESRWVGWFTSTATEPTEDTEESSDNVDTEDGGNELPRWKGIATTSDEDEPILGEGGLVEKCQGQVIYRE